MKSVWCYSIVAAVGVLTGCASKPTGDSFATAGENITGARMSASYSSDSSGVEDLDTLSAGDEYAAPIQLTLDQLPPAAQATVRREAADRRILKIKREMRQGETVYKVEFRRDDGELFHGILMVAVDGSLFTERHISEAAGSAVH